jgi:hypothetical protein
MARADVAAFLVEQVLKDDYLGQNANHLHLTLASRRARSVRTAGGRKRHRHLQVGLYVSSATVRS